MSNINGALVVGLILFSLAFVRNSSQKEVIQVLGEVRISFTNNGTHTEFAVLSPLGNGVSLDNFWLGVGLNSVTDMVAKLNRSKTTFSSNLLSFL